MAYGKGSPLLSGGRIQPRYLSDVPLLDPDTGRFPDEFAPASVAQAVADVEQGVAAAEAARDEALSHAELFVAPAKGVLDSIFGTDVSNLSASTVRRGELVANVKDYGATGDGVTDDTSAIMAAIATGKHIRLEPSRTYSVTQLVFSNPAHINGNNATFKRRTTGTVNSFITVSASNVTLESVNIDGGAGTVTEYWLQVLDNCENVKIRGCNFSNLSLASSSTTGAVLRLRPGCHNATVEQCSLSDFVAPVVGRGILVSGATGGLDNLRILNNNFDNIGPRGDGDGIVIQDFPGRVDCLIEGNTFHRMHKRAIKIQTPGAQIHHNLIYMNAALPAFSAIAVYADDCTVANNRISGDVGTAGIDLLPAGSVASSGVVITNNAFHMSAATRAGSAHGVSGNAGLVNSTINHNVFRNFRHGVSLQATVSEVSITGNVFQGLQGSAVMLNNKSATSGAPVIRNVAITGNVGNDILNYFVHNDGDPVPSEVVMVGNAVRANFGQTGPEELPGVKLGFFDKTPIVRRTATADAASILAALKAYGLLS